jgi:hypothetical protein
LDEPHRAASDELAPPPHPSAAAQEGRAVVGNQRRGERTDLRPHRLVGIDPVADRELARQVADDLLQRGLLGQVAERRAVVPPDRVRDARRQVRRRGRVARIDLGGA